MKIVAFLFICLAVLAVLLDLRSKFGFTPNTLTMLEKYPTIYVGTDF